MEQHPVPQHIASFEFKLFGNLTVRQFVTLAIPLSLAAAIFFSSLPTLVRFPASALIAIFAFIAALVPISGRPLHKWVIAFIRAILSPTQRIWVKELQIPQFLSVVLAPPLPEVSADQSITAGGREKLRQYLRSLPKKPLAPLDVKEQLAVQRLELEGLPSVALAKEGKLPPPIIWPQAISLPQITLAEAAPQITSHAKPYVLPGLEKKLTKAPGAAGPKAKLASETNFAVENVIPIKTPDKQIMLIHGIGKTRVRKLHFAPPLGFNLARLPIRGEKRFEISEELKRRFQFDENLFEKQFTPRSPQGKVGPAEQSPEPLDYARGKLRQRVAKGKRAVPKPKLTTDTTQGVLAKTASSPNLAATISQSWPKSAKPALAPNHLARAQIIPLTNRPNVISGITTAPDGTPLPNAILIVKDTIGIPKRAVKTNKLGQFLSATPLENGTYTVEVESESHTFEPFTLNLTGQVLAPLEIKAKT